MVAWKIDKKILFLALILLGLIFLLANFFYYYAHDDLSFDYVGYAMRAFHAFDGGWNNNHYLGYPASVFTPLLPSVMPVLFKAIGLGAITLPITLSILLVRILLLCSFVLVGKNLNLKALPSLVLGVVFVFNPFTFNFLNRYYELTAWLFFVIFFWAIFNLLEKEKKAFFLPSVLSLSAIILSSQIPAIFAGILSLLLINSIQRLKKIVLIFLFGQKKIFSFPASDFSYEVINTCRKIPKLITRFIWIGLY